jgi:zinc/manganese transport system substrate-binding protein
MNKPILLKMVFAILLLFPLILFAKPITIVAAENFYGDIAQTIGGSHVKVISIMSNPNQDPHLFSATPSVAKAIAAADIIVYNGIGYDAWMQRLLTASKNHSQQIIVVADLLNKKMGDNPHIWYNPATMQHYAKKLTDILIEKDPAHAKDYQQQLSEFNQKDKIFSQYVNTLKQKIQHTAVIATEPVFNDMADALGLVMHGKDFQLSVMNDISPSPSQTKSFENDLRNKTVKVLIFNNQVSDPTTQRVQNIAKSMHIPTIGVSETEPAGKKYFEWMRGQLEDLEKALQ